MLEFLGSITLARKIGEGQNVKPNGTNMNNLSV
jgi:hypothetical protein